MNDFMSVGIHRLWKHHLIQDIGVLTPKPIIKDSKIVDKEPIRVLDVASGTGDIAFKIIEFQK